MGDTRGVRFELRARGTGEGGGVRAVSATKAPLSAAKGRLAFFDFRALFGELLGVKVVVVTVWV